MALTDKQKDRLLELQSKLADVEEEMYTLMEMAMADDAELALLLECVEMLDATQSKIGLKFG